MEYLYHHVPVNMKGQILYPLNVLKESDPDVYIEHIKKYNQREYLLVTKVPPLDCFWNDVIHLTAVAPTDLKVNLAKADIQLSSSAWFKIPISLIKGENSIAFTYRKDQSLIQYFKEYEHFDPARMDIYRNVPEETIEYYKQKKAEGVRPLLFYLVPHILYKGTIDTSGLEIVYW